jgi:3-deoxy-D-manno-octulosonic-acid transferase
MSLSTGAEQRGLVEVFTGAFYNAAWGAVLGLTAPLRLTGISRWREKCGLYRPELSPRQRVWIHACSVGEVRVALCFLGELRRRCPNLSCTLSSVTPEGWSAAKAGLPDQRDQAVFFPFDARRAMRNAFDRLNPSFMILTEVELWPNHLREASTRGIPVFVINGRLSADDERNYRRAGRFMRRTFAVPDLVCARGPSEAGRFRRLGARQVTVAGDIKYETLAQSERIAPGREHHLVLGASTHPGEENILLRAVKELRRSFPALRLVLAPRHPRRAAAISEAAARDGFRAGLSSHGGQDADVLVVDQIGQLADWYTKATVCFVGKSLTARGGQNFLEAAAGGCPVVIGPHVDNFADATESFLDRKAIAQIADAGSLTRILARLLADPEERERMATAAAAVIGENSGAAKRTADLILARLPRMD